MGKDTGFIEFEKQAVPRREIQERVQDFREYDLNYSDNDIRQQASRCMDCGIPFCHMGCPLGNMIPDWNDLVYRDQWQDALELYTVPTIFRNSPDASAPLPVKTPAC